MKLLKGQLIWEFYLVLNYVTVWWVPETRDQLHETPFYLAA